MVGRHRRILHPGQVSAPPTPLPFGRGVETTPTLFASAPCSDLAPWSLWQIPGLQWVGPPFCIAGCRPWNRDSPARDSLPPGARHAPPSSNAQGLRAAPSTASLSTRRLKRADPAHITVQLAARNAFALAQILDRIVVLPRLLCYCDMYWGSPTVPECVTWGSDLALPFECPADNLFNLPFWEWAKVGHGPHPLRLLPRSNASGTMQSGERQPPPELL